MGGTLAAEPAHRIAVGAGRWRCAWPSIARMRWRWRVSWNRIVAWPRCTIPAWEPSAARARAALFGSRFGGLLGVELADGVDCFDFLNRLRIVLMATHLGDTRSLALPAAHTIYYEMGAERRQQMSIADSLIRVSVGIEDEATCCLTSIRRSTAACKDNFGHSRGAACSALAARVARKHCRNQGQTMLIQIADAFTPEEAAEIRRRLDAAEWVDGKVTAGYQSAEVKRNRQLPEQHPLAQELGNLILQRLSANNLFMSAALPRKIFPPLFNRYEGGEAFGYHVDNAVRALSGGSERVRTDLSATLFFPSPIPTTAASW